MFGTPVYIWNRSPSLRLGSCSTIWKGLLDAYPILGNDLGWRTGNGVQVFIGIEPVMGLDSSFKPSKEVISQLHSQQIYVFS